MDKWKKQEYEREEIEREREREEVRRVRYGRMKIEYFLTAIIVKALRDESLSY